MDGSGGSGGRGRVFDEECKVESAVTAGEEEEEAAPEKLEIRDRRGIEETRSRRRRETASTPLPLSTKLPQPPPPSPPARPPLPSSIA